MALDVYREIPSVLISTSGIFPVYRLKPCVNLYLLQNENEHIHALLYTLHNACCDKRRCILYVHINIYCDTNLKQCK